MVTLITGATGLVGGHIARRLGAAGDRLRILVRPRSPREGLEGVQYEEAPGDVRDLESLRRAMKGVDRVVHAASIVRIDPFAADRMQRVNVDGTRNVLAAARDAGVRRLLYVSSIAAVGHGTLDRPAEENMSWELGSRGPYWSTKRAAEDLVLGAAARGEVDAVAINPSYVFGSHDVKPGSGGVLLAIASGLVAFYPEGGMGFVNARDVAEGALLALEKGRTGQRYILSGENLTLRQMITMAAEEAGVHPPHLFMPRLPMKALALIGDRVGPLFPRAFLYLNSTSIDSLFETAYVSFEKARRELGYAPHPVREGIHEAYAWFAKTGRLHPAPWPLRRAGANGRRTPLRVAT